MAGICAVNSLVLTKIAARGVTFQLMEEAGVKLNPVTVSVKLGWPATTLVGEMETIFGEG